MSELPKNFDLLSAGEDQTPRAGQRGSEITGGTKPSLGLDGFVDVTAV
jgi:hypothetical protein